MAFIERRLDGHVAVVTLNRPEALNAISGEMARELAGESLTAASDPAAWVIVLRAVGEKAFCVGADLKERNRLDDAGWMRNRALLRSMFDSIRACPQPTIASVFGFALGGGFELALNCDLIVASEDVVFGLPETRVGIVPGGGGTQLLARKVGPVRAKDVILAGRRIAAAEALDWGLASRVVPREELDAATMALANDVCRNSPVGVQAAKAAIDRGLDVTVEHGIEIEEVAWQRAVASEDRREGIAAFIEKRDPEWSGR